MFVAKAKAEPNHNWFCGPTNRTDSFNFPFPLGIGSVKPQTILKLLYSSSIVEEKVNDQWYLGKRHSWSLCLSVIVIVINDLVGIEDLTVDNEDSYWESSYSASCSSILGGLLSATNGYLILSHVYELYLDLLSHKHNKSCLKTPF